MGIKSQKVGKDWEQEVMKYYFNKGYYVEKRPTQTQGTVYDILVARYNSCLFIECKHTTSDKLYFKSCGLEKKKDELNNFVKKTKNDVLILIKSDVVGTYWLKWTIARDVFEKLGYLDLQKHCIKCQIEDNNK